MAVKGIVFDVTSGEGELIITNHFSSPDRAVGEVCVSGQYWTEKVLN